eukprot:symbB.v1.2.027735.t1/scaffold2868.1/size68506/2
MTWPSAAQFLSRHGAIDAAFVAAPSPQEVPSSALHFPVAGTGNRAVTPRRVAVRVIRTGSPMAGTQVTPLSSMAYPGVSEKGWCRTPPPGPVAFVRFHPPTILEGARAFRQSIRSRNWPVRGDTPLKPEVMMASMTYGAKESNLQATKCHQQQLDHFQPAQVAFVTVATCAAVAARYWRRGSTQGRGFARSKPRVVALKGHDHGESGHSHGEAMGHSHDSHAEHGGHSHDGHSHGGHSETHSHDVHSHDTHSAEHSHDGHDSHGHSMGHGCCGGLGHGHSHGEVPEWLPGRRRLQRLMDLSKTTPWIIGVTSLFVLSFLPLPPLTGAAGRILRLAGPISVFLVYGIPALAGALQHAAELDIHFLMTLAAFASVAIGHGREGAMLLLLFALSEVLEACVKMGFWCLWPNDLPKSLRFPYFLRCFHSLVSGTVDPAMVDDVQLNDVEVGFASTLLGAMVFLMSLTYFTNHSDQDIRRYTYEVISQTIAIFCAVMVFQYINDATDKAMIYFQWDSLPFAVHMTQMIIWYSALQFHLYYISFQGAVALAKHKFAKVGPGPDAQQQVSVWTALQSLWGTEHIAFSELHPLDHIEDLQSQMTCWKVLLSHIAGFAAINAFGTLQQSEPWRENWTRATTVVALATLTMLLIQWYFDGQRRKVAETWKATASVYDDRMEDVYNECFIMWLEEAEEPEDNVLALTVSFLSVQAIRFCISGTLPDVEGLDRWDLETTRSVSDIAALFAAGAVFCIGTFALDIYAGRHLEIDNGEQEEPRVVQVAMAACNQAFAWCLYFACKWNLATYVFHNAQEEKMLLQLELATAVSLLAFFAIWVLDKLADLDATGDETDHAIIQVIGGFSILVGFAW